MKRLKSKGSEAKKQKKNQTIIGVILIIVMFGSVFGIFVGSWGDRENSKIDYNGFKFIKENNFWILEIGDFQFAFKYNPNEVSEINTEAKYLNNYYGVPLYISSDYPESTYEIVSNLDQIVLRIQPACLNESACEEDLPTKTCEDNFIVIEEKNETNIIQDNNCVFIQGPQENLTMISDEFLFHILGVR